jgi:DNA-binding LacI/PurR family transcriptional regulator/anti-anti-sigma regulatory factor
MAPTHTIGIITRNFESLYHTPLIHALHARLSERGYRLLGIMGTPGEIAAARLAFDRVDGWLAINITAGVEELRGAGKPVVLISGTSGDLPSVVPDNHGGTAAAIEHLLALGRTRIAFVTNAVNPDFRERYAAYGATLAAHGIALDPSLVLDAQSYEVHEVYQAVRRRLAGGWAIDAAFCANDWLAFGTMQAVQEAGRRIPEDVAVIGFDDIAEAQFATPPLTSVRQNPAEMGRVALELLLDQIERGITPSRCTMAPTELIVRQSSMAEQQSAPGLSDSGRYRGEEWQAQLARDLAQQLSFSALPPGTPAEQVWPGVGALVAALADVVEGREPAALPASIWEPAIGARQSGTIAAIIELLRGAGAQRTSGAAHDAAERLTRWLLACQHEVMHRQVVENIDQAARDRQLFISERTLLNQIGAGGASPRLIDWMVQSRADWAALGLWRGAPAGAGGGTLELASTYVRDAGAAPSVLQIAPERFPPIELLPESVRDSLEYLIKLTAVGDSSRQWGYLAAAERFFWTFNDTETNRNMYLTAALEREELLASLEERQATLQAAYERERGLADTIRELGCPLIPLLKGVLLVPLVGAIDTARTAQIVERVLEGVVGEQADHVLLDITGVPLIDTQVAAGLIQTAQAVRLLGARVTLVGVRPEIAQSVVGLGVDLRMFETRPTLAAALQALLRR